MTPKELKPKKALNKAFLRVKPGRTEIETFKASMISFIESRNNTESEEFHKNLIIGLLKKIHYDPNHFINTKGRNDLVIHNGNTARSSVGVIIETKKMTNKSEMITTCNLNAKAFQELVLYYLRERITLNNLEVKNLIATNVNEWFIFDAIQFDRIFAQNKVFVKQFIDFEAGRLSDIKTDFFYKHIAEPFIASLTCDIEFTYFNIEEYQKTLRNCEGTNESSLITIYKLLSPEHLLKLPFINDSNSLDKGFYTEMLHIIGLIETKEGSRRLIGRNEASSRNSGSILEDAIIQLDTLDKLSRLQKKSQFGFTQQEQLFNVALELSITWINRILFLKLLEAQLLSYHKGDKSYSILNPAKIKNYGDINSLFFQVLARKYDERNDDVKRIFERVPYLNSSLFEPTETEQVTLFVSNLKGDKTIPVLASTVLKDNQGRKQAGHLTTLEYLLAFLDAYDFSNEGSEQIQEDNKTLINASVLGLIFEKINGYKDGSFFTPGLITMHMCNKTIRNAVLKRFNEFKKWNCKTIDELYDKIDNREEANMIVNSIKICDPAVGSGHYLVSALNEIIALKNNLRILQDRDGRRLKEYQVDVVNDDLVITDEDGELIEYNPGNKESQRVQEALFYEKQIIIENCLFGVDINSNSVKICRLRLWIELLKHAFYKENGELETLPNIDINIKYGNSLVSRFAIDADLKQVLRKKKWSIDGYRKAVDTYRNAKSKEQKREMEILISDIKTGFRSEIAANDPIALKLLKLRGELYRLTNQGEMFEASEQEKSDLDIQTVQVSTKITELEKKVETIKANRIFETAFEWRFEFPEILDNGGNFVGFDVVIGNPPYLLVFDEDLKGFLEQSYPEFKRNNDLYVAFFKRAFSLLKEQGCFSFITPNTFMKGEYFRGLRKFLSSEKQITEIIDFGSIVIFDEASVFCAITSAENTAPSAKWLLKSNLHQPLGYIESNTDDFILKDAIISKLNKLAKFDEYFLIKDIGFNYWTKGRGKVRGGSIGSRVFYNGPKDHPNDIPFIKGIDIQKYSISFSNNFLRHDCRSFLAENDTFRYNGEIMGVVPKIIYRQTSNRIVAAIDLEKNLNDKTVHTLVNKVNSNIDLRAILAILNSKMINYFFQSFKQEEGRAFAQVKTVDIKNLPLAVPSAQILKELSELADKIINTKKLNSSISTVELEDQIDELVYKLYGLSDEDVEIINNS
jgi:adenine-specific DNA-methyltransferase